jgi:hypothetical protein
MNTDKIIYKKINIKRKAMFSEADNISMIGGGKCISIEEINKKLNQVDE